MTAAELASFRALLQAQSPGPPLADRGLFARMRARLTVVENDAPTPREPPQPARLAPRLEVVATAAPVPSDGPLADPPPAQPPAFGRRGGWAPPTWASSPEPAEPVPSRRAAASIEACSTPDELDDLRNEAAPPSPRVDGPTPGVIAGWSRARPQSAQRRLLGRLEAVLLAEREGLGARRAADAPQDAHPGARGV